MRIFMAAAEREIMSDMTDLQTAKNRYTERRLEDHLRPIHLALVRWAPEARHDGAPRWPDQTIIKRLIDQGHGASQAGAPPMVMDREVEFTDWAVGQLGDIKRKVIYTEYVHCVGWDMSRKRGFMLKRYGVRIAVQAWREKLRTSREILYSQFKTIGAWLDLDTALQIVAADGELCEKVENVF
jgi:hypothetical protein